MAEVKEMDIEKMMAEIECSMESIEDLDINFD